MKFKLKWDGLKVSRKVDKASIEGLFDSIEFLLGESNKIVPHDEGTLQRSGETSLDKEKKEAAISYDTPYAVRLHEHPEYRFQKGREGKWLEKTMKDEKNWRKINQYLKDKIENALKG